MMAPATAKSRSASSKTMNGALPPSSKESFLSVSADCFISNLPTPVEPVKETLRTIGLDVSAAPTSAVLARALMMLTTPLGIPARWASSAIARAVKGVSPGDFTTTVQPAARAGPIFLVIIAAGKFHGVMSPHTPTGSLTVKTRLPGMLGEIVSPSTLGASSANHSKKLAAYATSPFASANGLPFSHVMSLARSSWLSIIN